jgi:hypothetical protein
MAARAPKHSGKQHKSLWTQLYSAAAKQVCKYGKTVFAVAATATLLSAAASGAVINSGATSSGHSGTHAASKEVTQPTPESSGQDRIVASELKYMETGSDGGQTTALVEAGGGAAGAISAGVMSALKATEGMAKYQEKNGTKLNETYAALWANQNGKLGDGSFNATFDAYDESYTASVGSLVEEYARSGNVYEGASIFTNNLDDRFLSKTRVVLDLAKFLLGFNDDPPGMNISYVRNGIQGGFGPDKALNATKVMDAIKNGPPLFIVATDAKTQKPMVIDTRNMSYDQVLATTLAACGMPGITGHAQNGIEDAMYSGESVPLDQGASAANTVIVLNNEPTNRTGYEGSDWQLMKQFILFCSCEDIKSFKITDPASRQAIKNIMTTANNGSANNVKELQAAQNNTDKYLVLGSPPGDPELSSSELDKGLLTSAAQRAYLNTMAVLLRDGINDGSFIADNNSRLRVLPPPQLGQASSELIVKIDKNGKAVAKIVNLTKHEKKHGSKNKQIMPSGIELIAAGSKNPQEMWAKWQKADRKELFQKGLDNRFSLQNKNVSQTNQTNSRPPRHSSRIGAHSSFPRW